jgi:hypothetical protein
MKDQHKKIKGYRDLSLEEINLMNKIKAKSEEVGDLINEFNKMRNVDAEIIGKLTDEQLSETRRALALAKTKLQTGFMWFVRAVALPDSF